MATYELFYYDENNNQLFFCPFPAYSLNHTHYETIHTNSGTTTKDTDPALLKKAIKRKFKKKEKSQKAWKSRMEQTRESIDERQKIRGHNLDQRRIGGATGANLSKKRINDEDGKGADDSKGGTTEPGGKKRARLGPHAGKGRAGFEGKKQDFINKSNKGKSNDK